MGCTDEDDGHDQNAPPSTTSCKLNSSSQIATAVAVAPPRTLSNCWGSSMAAPAAGGRGGSLENSESSSSPDSETSTPTTPTPSTYSHCSFSSASASVSDSMAVVAVMDRNLRQDTCTSTSACASNDDTNSNKSNISIDISDDVDCVCGDADTDLIDDEPQLLDVDSKADAVDEDSSKTWKVPEPPTSVKPTPTQPLVEASIIKQRNETQASRKIKKDTNCLNNNIKINNNNTGSASATQSLEKCVSNTNANAHANGGGGRMAGGWRGALELGFNCMSKLFPLHVRENKTADKDKVPKMNNEVRTIADKGDGVSEPLEKLPVQVQGCAEDESQRLIRSLSISKSNSESNIPTMCHNYLGMSGATLPLPLAMSTDTGGTIIPLPEDELPVPVTGQQPRPRRNSDSCTKVKVASSESGDSGTKNATVENCEQNTKVNPAVGETGSAAAAVVVTATASPVTVVASGPKFKLMLEGDVQVCKLKHDQNLMSKLTSSKLLRRWESHHIYLNDSSITSKTPIGSFNNSISYWQMEDMYVVIRWDSGRRYVIRIVLPDGSLLLQGQNAYVRDQWFHSIMWKRNIFKYQNLMRSSKRPEVILKEMMSLLDFATTTPLQDECISHVPIEIVSNLLESAGELLGRKQVEDVLSALSPLLEKSHPPPSLCRFFSLQCRSRPRCPLIMQHFTPVVRRALKHNVDFGKYPHMRRFIQDYIQAMNSHNDGINLIRSFVKSIHGTASSCPHPRVMSNLVSVCLAAIFAIFERNNAKRAFNMGAEIKDIPWDEQVLSYLAVFDTISEFDDWRPALAQLLQCMPFPYDALNLPLFTKSLSSVIRRIGTDPRCCVHQMVMGIRDEKEGWFHQYSPSNLACSDDFELWGLMLGRLLNCCCRRKRFLSQLSGKLLGSCLLLALRENVAAQEALCLLLEWQLISSDDQRVQIATTLQSTPTGSANYATLCSRQLHLKELQQKGGPRKLTLPSRSTDSDLTKLLSCGSFGNLECLSLAFTQVTSACAEQLIKLPSLRYLNLWSTQFGDSGLQLISEHLLNLQVLNLCETPVTDKGLLSLTALRELRKLNLNSTHLSLSTLDSLKKELPALKEVDVRYTDAW